MINWFNGPDRCRSQVKPHDGNCETGFRLSPGPRIGGGTVPYKDPERQREYQRRWMSERRAKYFEGKTCAVCGTSENLELDHVDPHLKISHRIWSWKWDRILEETSKCQILCQKHHQEKTWSHLGEVRCGTVRSYRRGCRCDSCRTSIAEQRRSERAARKQRDTKPM